jgi:hypothetical protein
MVTLISVLFSPPGYCNSQASSPNLINSSFRNFSIHGEDQRKKRAYVSQQFYESSQAKIGPKC